jgi:hypothetical protein
MKIAQDARPQFFIEPPTKRRKVRSERDMDRVDVRQGLLSVPVLESAWNEGFYSSALAG